MFYDHFLINKTLDRWSQGKTYIHNISIVIIWMTYFICGILVILSGELLFVIDDQTDDLDFSFIYIYIYIIQ